MKASEVQKYIYIAVAILFFISAFGGLLGAVISWHTQNIGQKIGGVTSILINLLIGIAIFYVYTSAKKQQMMSQDDFDIIVKEMKGGEQDEKTRRVDANSIQYA